MGLHAETHAEKDRYVHALDRVQKEAAQFTDHTMDCDWETLAKCRISARYSALFKACCAERAWKALRGRLRGPYCLSGVDHVWKIRDRKHRTDIGKYSL